MLIALFGGQPGAAGVAVTRVTIQNELIVRIPLEARPVMPQVEWVERKNAKCIAVGEIRQALMSGPDQLDFIMGDHGRVRAHLDEDCPALDFYGGFYLQQQDDRLCAGRDEIHSRMGGDCAIVSLKHLQPVVRR